MSKLTRKFLLGVSVILGAVALLSFYLNVHFVERYALYQEKRELDRICDRLLQAGEDDNDIIRELEETEDVVIASVAGTEDNEVLNRRIRQAFLDKGIGLKKYWLWEQDQQSAMRDGRRMRLYHQEKLHYSLLVEYLSKGGSFMAVARIIPSMERSLAIINRVTAAVLSGAVCVMFFFLSILVRRITVPLQKIGETAKAISNLDFQTVEIRTKDELETLAGDMNEMSRKLKEANEALEEKNRQMQELLSNVSHDLKTPVALVKAYAGGIRDGLDDGTFVDTIIVQNHRMEVMIEQLLNLSRVRQAQMQREPVDVSEILLKETEGYRICTDGRALEIVCEIEEHIMVDTVREAVRLICTNLLSNAVKYASKGEIIVRLSRLPGGRCRLLIENPLESGREPDLARIWQPYYVGEESRSSELSGTGLGLAIVRAAAEKADCALDCAIENGKIIFTVIF